MKKGLLIVSMPLVLAFTSAADDWPQYRADALRSGYTRESLPGKLGLRWTFSPPHPPDPAWQGEDTRMPFDHAHHAVVADGALYFGSSADCKVYCLDARDGGFRWSFITDAPVRFAPAVWRDRVFAASDDGYLYCLSAESGELLWKTAGGPGDGSMLLGNDRMVSRWPARGGLVVLDDTVYFAAGIWPTEGIYLRAVDPETGQSHWVCDAYGALEMDQPHPTARAKSGLSAQGYLVATSDALIVPTGRAVPAVLDRADGAFRYFHLQAFGHSGGAPIIASDGFFINGGILFDVATGKQAAQLRAAASAVTPSAIIVATGSTLIALDAEAPLIEKETVDRKGQPATKTVLDEPLWRLDLPAPADGALIVAGKTAAMTTTDQEVVLVDVAKQEVTWRHKFEDRPLGLAVANRRLYVSTDRGDILCFARRTGKGAHLALARTTPRQVGGPYADAAEEILRESGVREGYCVDLGCGDGRLAYELARRSDLRVYGVDPDPENVRAARTMLDAAGLYGTRVTIHQADPSKSNYPSYFADLVVSGRSVSRGQPIPDTEIDRLLRPYGGIACLGRPGAMSKRAAGPLEGAGAWTHQYGTPANTCRSTDQHVRDTLRMLWYRDSDFDMPSRHGRGPAPLFSSGRLIVEGNHGLRAVNAYNGRLLWEFPIPDILIPYDQEHLVGVAATGSNLCMENDTVYVAAGNRCLAIDAATGTQLREFSAPVPEGQEGTWGYLACVDGILFGSVSNTDHIVRWAFVKSDMSRLFTESTLFFALDAATGEVKWTYDPEDSIRHNAIAVADGRVYLIDRPLTVYDRLDYDAEAAKQQGETPQEPSGELLALDAATGEVLWRRDEDVYGTLLAVSIEHDVLLMTQQHTRFKLKSERGGRMTAFRASDGGLLWDVPSDPKGKASRPLINETTIYNEPGAWNLLTGERLDFNLERSYGCGIMASSPYMILYRSATLGYVDLLDNRGTENYGGLRPGCWINAIPAGGLVLVPDATSACVCSYLVKAWVALEPVPRS